MCPPMTKKGARKAIALLRKWDYLCVICGLPFANLACVTVEHLIPRSMPDASKCHDNTAPSHYRCNQLRQTESVIQTAALINAIASSMPAKNFVQWLNKIVPREGGTPWYCTTNIVDAEWFVL